MRRLTFASIAVSTASFSMAFWMKFVAHMVASWALNAVVNSLLSMLPLIFTMLKLVGGRNGADADGN